MDEDFYIGATDIDELYFCPYSFFMGKIMGGRIFEQSHTEYANIDGDLVPTGKFVVYDYKKSRSRGLDHFLNHNVCQLGYIIF